MKTAGYKLQDSGFKLGSRLAASCILPPVSRIANAAFTLLEILVVVAIIAVVMTIGIPFMNTAIGGGKGMTRAVKDVQEACSHARAMAILQQTTAELIIRPRDGSFEIGVASGPAVNGMARMDSPSVSGQDWRMADRKGSGGGGAGAGFSAKLPDTVHIEGLGVNGEDWTEDPVARVRFYSNGTSDEMSVVLLDDKNERRNIWLEVVTGLPELETDPLKFKAR